MVSVNKLPRKGDRSHLLRNEIMMNSKTACKIWKDLVSIYKKDVGNGTPKATVKKLIDKWGLWNTKQIFAIITAIKEHDGRISVENREKLSQIPVDRIRIDRYCSTDHLYPIVVAAAVVIALLSVLADWCLRHSKLSTSKILRRVPAPFFSQRQ